jgi:3'(2'), 5'-bisphosphate nucleotidase
MTANELDLMLKTLVSIADEAGCEILKHYKSDLSHNKKSDGSPITLADIAANKIITSKLRLNWPNIYILSEEDNYSQNKISGCKSYWAVDPLDGTKEFIKMNDEFTVNISLVLNGLPAIGLIYAPALDLMYLGNTVNNKVKKRRLGKWKTLSKIEEMTTNLTKRTLKIGVSRSHPSNELNNWLKSINKYTLHEIGSSLKFCYLAENLIDIYPRLGNTYLWDTAAGHAILIASGGSITSIKNEQLIYNKYILNDHFIAMSCFHLKYS